MAEGLESLYSDRKIVGSLMKGRNKILKKKNHFIATTPKRIEPSDAIIVQQNKATTIN